MALARQGHDDNSISGGAGYSGISLASRRTCVSRVASVSLWAWWSRRPGSVSAIGSGCLNRRRCRRRAQSPLAETIPIAA